MTQAKLQSPGIMMFESSVTPAAETVTVTNGVATLGFATRGPVNKLVRLTSLTEFANTFGDPCPNQHWSHILAKDVLAQNTVLYFMRLADERFASKATCYACADKAIVAASGTITEQIESLSYFTAEFESAAVTNPVLKITLDNVSEEISMDFSASWQGKTNIAYVPIATVISALRKKFGDLYNFKKCLSSENNCYYVSVECKNPKTHALSLTVAVEDAKEGTAPVAAHTDSTYPTSYTANYHFEIKAKDIGSGMNDVMVVKSTQKNYAGNTETWSVVVKLPNGTILEEYSGIPADKNFADVINDNLSFIEIDKESLSTTGTPVWVDGTYVLGRGMLLSDGQYMDSGVSQDPGIKKGSDGVPASDDAIEDLYISALGDAAFTNCDENSFSILATPSCGRELVQDTAIGVCAARGDCIYLIDTPCEDCQDKSGVKRIVDWSNGDATFQNSQAAIYYGWFSKADPYDTSVNIDCPASCYIAPKMIALDNAMGEYYPPAGVQNGIITASDYSYSPDAEDRDLMLNEDAHNVVNPIVYSNTRGIVCLGQKTTDRTTSPLNRVGVRRMTNAIKRELRSKLQALLFQPNNEYSRSRARKYCDDIMSPLQSKGCIEGYEVNVVSGTGANRNDLNVYLSFRPYGLIEFIYVYVNITDAGITVGETV